MEKTDKFTNIYLSILLPVGAGGLAWALYYFPADKIDWRLGALAILTVCFSAYLRIQLPRTKIHLTTSDAMVILSILWYGGEVAILLTILETTFTSLNLRRQGLVIKSKTIVINVLIAAIAVFITTGVVRLFFGPARGVMADGNSTTFVWLLAVMAGCLFLLNSILVSIFVAAKTNRPVIGIWNNYCLNALVMYLTGAVLAGFTAKAVQQINVYLFAAVAMFFGIVYLTYRRYITDIKQTAAKAEQAERERAEQAEVHVKDLQHYVRKLEQSGEELRKSHETLRHAAYHDALTGLPNRNHFIEAIRVLLKSCRKMSG